MRDEYKSGTERISNFETLLIYLSFYTHQESSGDTQGSDYCVSQHSQRMKKSLKFHVRTNW